ncbi:two-component sensor histidine kinase [Lentzea sp. NBRC 105346]|uniref:sensor histidine kinase n=1 Tax=Lentzea sp. NBRC 105346 TaxID=3032205 RepID=UPI0024A5D902|nr:histidine kinase [Lentzea sp. NBRC 105346]GLZ31289.1 two-component sensor histidine kinase [Lentzea sp. NBRC 105346]
MTEALPRRFALPDVRASFAALLDRTLVQLRCLTPLRIAGEIAILLAAIVLDVWPGYWAEKTASGWVLAGLLAGYVVILPLRLVLPTTAFLLGILLTMSGPYGGAALAMFVSYTAGRRVESWRRAAVAAVLAFGLLVVFWDGTPLGSSASYSVFLMIVVYCVGVALPFLVGRYLAAREALVAAMQEREQRMRTEHRMLSRQVRLRERSRIAQDMHDGLGHRLSLISVHAGALALDTNLDARQREAIGVLRKAALTGMDELRTIIGVLRSEDEPDDDPARRTVEAIDELVEGARRAGMLVSLVRGGQATELPAKVSHAAYRVAQEGLTNASKHAPGATVQVTVKYEPDALVVEVRNNPPRAGVSSKGAGVGLIGLGERVRVAGGMLHVGALPAGGYRIAAVLPYEEQHVASPAEDPEDEEPPARIRKWAGTGSIVAACVVVAVVIGGFTWIGTRPITEVVQQSVIDSIQLGQAEADVLARLPRGTEPLIADGDRNSQAAPEPPGAHCVYHVTDEQSYLSGGTRIVRFCFADGKLVEKKIHVQRKK